MNLSEKSMTSKINIWLGKKPLKYLDIFHLKNYFFPLSSRTLIAKSRRCCEKLCRQTQPFVDVCYQKTS